MDTIRARSKIVQKMISPRWRKVLRDLWGNKTRTALVVMAIAVGVFAIGVVAGTQTMLSADLNSRYRDTAPASATLFTVQPFDDELVATVRRMEGVVAAEGRRMVAGRIQVGPDEWRDLRLDVIDDFDSQTLNRVGHEQGAWPPPTETVLIERASLGLAQTGMGAWVRVEMGNGKERDLLVSGVAHDMHKMPAQFVGQTYGYITYDTLEWLGYPRSYNQLQVLVSSQNPAEIEAIISQVEDKIEKSGRTLTWTWLPEPGKHPADDIVQPMLTVLVVLGGLSLVLSALLVVNTMSAMLSQQVRQVGVMKTIGARTDQIMALYLGTVAIFCLLALGIAVPLGAAGAYFFTAFLAQIINFDLVGFRIPLTALALQIMAGLFVPLLAALWPIMDSTRMSVQEAINSYGLGKGQFGEGRLDGLLERVRGLSRPLLLSLRNTFRRKARLALTLLTLTLAGAIFIAVFSVRTSLLLTLDEFAGFWQYDILITFDHMYRTDQIQATAVGIPDVVEAESWGNASALRVRPDGSDGPNFDLLAPAPDSTMIRPLLVAGRWILPDDQNALVVDTDILGNEADLSVGDVITLKINGRESEWQIVGIAKPTISGNVLRFGTAYTPAATLSRELRRPEQANTVRIALTDHSRAAQIQAAGELERIFNAAGMGVASTRTTISVRDSVVYQFNILVLFLSVMAALLALVGSLGLMGTMSMNVLERAREIGVMRAIGASDGAVYQIFMVEGMFIGALSWPLGVLLAYPISRVLADTLGMQFLGSALTYEFSLVGAAAWLGAILVLAAVASFLPAQNAAQMTVREVLAYE